MNLIKIRDDIYVNPEQVVSVEKLNMSYNTPSGGMVGSDFNGSRIILKCGRKLHINNMFPDEILQKLNHAPLGQEGK